MSIDRSDAADARRLRWLLNGNGQFMNETYLQGQKFGDDVGHDAVRAKLDALMAGPGGGDARQLTNNSVPNSEVQA